MAQLSKSAADRQVIIDLKFNAKDAIAAIVQADEEIRKLKQEQKDLEKAMKEGTATQEQKERYVMLKAEIKDLTNTMKANQKELDNNIKMSKQNGDSINAMRAQLSKLRSEYEDLSKAERDSAKGVDMLNQIDSLTTSVKELEIAQQDYSRQVGNYEIAAQPARTALREMKMECQNLAVALNQVEGKMQAQQTVVQTLAATVGTESDEYKSAAAELQNLNTQYNQAKENLTAMEQKTGELADTIADSNQRINSFANDQQKVAAMQEGVGALTAAYDVLQGSLTALGVKSEAMVEIYAKMQIVQRSVNGVMTIYKALNKDSNLMIVVRQKLEQARLKWAKAYNAALEKQNASIVKNTAAEGANAAATTATTVAEGAATTATFSLKAAFDALTTSLLANPITGIAVAIGAAAAGIVAAVKKIVKSRKEAEEAEKQYAETIQKTSEAQLDSIKNQVSAADSVNKKYDEQIYKVKALYAIVKNESAAYKEKKQAVDELNRLVPEYNGKLDKTGKIIQGNAKEIDKYIEKLKDKAKAEALTESLYQAYLKQTTAQREKDAAQSKHDWYDNQLKFWTDRRDEIFRNGVAYKGELDDVNKNIEYYQRNLTATDGILGDLIAKLNDANREVAVGEKQIMSVLGLDLDGDKPKRGSGNKPSGSDKGDSDEVKEAKKEYDKLIKLAEDYQKDLIKIVNDSSKTRYEIEENRYDAEVKKIKESKKEIEDLIKKIQANPKDYDKAEERIKKLTEALNILTNSLDEAEVTHKKNMSEIKREADVAFNEIMTKLGESLKKSYDTEEELLIQERDRKISALELEKQKELEAHEYSKEQQLMIETQYDALIAQTRKDYEDKMTENSKKKAKESALIWVQRSQEIVSAMGSIAGSLGGLFTTLAEDNEEMQKYANALAYVEIMMSMAQGLAAAVAKGMEMGWPAAAWMIPAGIATVVSGIAQAIQVFKENEKVNSSPHFSQGGLVGDKTTNRKDDTVNAKLSLGEYVIRSEIVKKYGVDFFDRLNNKKIKALAGNYHFANGGLVQTPNVSNYTAIQDMEFNYDRMGEIFTAAVSDITPVVSVKEITTKQNRVKVKEKISSYR